MTPLEREYKMKKMDVMAAQELSFGLISREGRWTIEPLKTITYTDEYDTTAELKTLYPIEYVAFDDSNIKFSKDTFGDKKLTVSSGNPGDVVVFSVYKNHVIIANNIESLNKTIETVEEVLLK